MCLPQGVLRHGSLRTTRKRFAARTRSAPFTEFRTTYTPFRLARPLGGICQGIKVIEITEDYPGADSREFALEICCIRLWEGKGKWRRQVRLEDVILLPLNMAGREVKRRFVPCFILLSVSPVASNTTEYGA